MMRLPGLMKTVLLTFALALGLSACAQSNNPPAPREAVAPAAAPDYVLGPLDTIQVFVWRSPELSSSVPIRPDGRISLPLIEDLQAAGKTPTQLSRDIEEALKVYVQNPIVTVIVDNFQGALNQQVRVVGQAAQPQAIPYRAGMTVLDVVIATGGLTEFADGNRAVIVRYTGDQEQAYNVRLDDLIRYGDIQANVPMLPGDVLIIPEAWL